MVLILPVLGTGILLLSVTFSWVHLVGLPFSWELSKAWLLWILLQLFPHPSLAQDPLLRLGITGLHGRHKVVPPTAHSILQAGVWSLRFVVSLLFVFSEDRGRLGVDWWQMPSASSSSWCCYSLKELTLDSSPGPWAVPAGFASPSYLLVDILSSTGSEFFPFFSLPHDPSLSGADTQAILGLAFDF